MISFEITSRKGCKTLHDEQHWNLQCISTLYLQIIRLAQLKYSYYIMSQITKELVFDSSTKVKNAWSYICTSHVFYVVVLN
jgi:hypothetical protein